MADRSYAYSPPAYGQYNQTSEIQTQAQPQPQISLADFQQVDSQQQSLRFVTISHGQHNAYELDGLHTEVTPSANCRCNLEASERPGLREACSREAENYSKCRLHANDIDTTTTCRKSSDNCGDLPTCHGALTTMRSHVSGTNSMPQGTHAATCVHCPSHAYPDSLISVPMGVSDIKWECVHTGYKHGGAFDGTCELSVKLIGHGFIPFAKEVAEHKTWRASKFGTIDLCGSMLPLVTGEHIKPDCKTKIKHIRSNHKKINDKHNRWHKKECKRAHKEFEERKRVERKRQAKVHGMRKKRLDPVEDRELLELEEKKVMANLRDRITNVYNAMYSEGKLLYQSIHDIDRANLMNIEHDEKQALHWELKKEKSVIKLKHFANKMKAATIDRTRSKDKMKDHYTERMSAFLEKRLRELETLEKRQVDRQNLYSQLVVHQMNEINLFYEETIAMIGGSFAFTPTHSSTLNLNPFPLSTISSYNTEQLTMPPVEIHYAASTSSIAKDNEVARLNTSNSYKKSNVGLVFDSTIAENIGILPTAPLLSPTSSPVIARNPVTMNGLARTSSTCSSLSHDPFPKPLPHSMPDLIAPRIENRLAFSPPPTSSTVSTAPTRLRTLSQSPTPVAPCNSDTSMNNLNNSDVPHIFTITHTDPKE
eukprot:CFRG4692T1